MLVISSLLKGLMGFSYKSPSCHCEEVRRSNPFCLPRNLFEFKQKILLILTDCFVVPPRNDSFNFYKKTLKVLVCLIFTFFSIKNDLIGQKRLELEAKRQMLLQQIDQTTQQLNQTAQSRRATRDRLEALQNQIENREALLINLREGILEADEIIERTEEVLTALTDDMQKLKTEYALMMRKAYKMKMPSSSLFFVLSSNNFGDAYKRWQYFRQYDKFRKRQSKLIGETLKSLAAKNELLTQKKQQKTMLLGTNEQQATLLTAEKQDKDQLLVELKAEETRLSSTLQNQNKQNAQMNVVIERLIAAEIDIKRKASEARARRARDEADRLAREKERIKKRNESRQLKEKPDKIVDELPATNKPKPDLVITESAENLALSSEFRQNKGKLPPPATGVIVRDFGRQRVVDKVTTVNNGIDIRTEGGADVRAVFSGTVLVVSSISGLGNVVLIQHGNYYTVYSNLSAVSVKKGETVSTRQTIGRAGVNTVTKEPEIHFEVWLEKTHLNPTQWIAH